MYNYYNVSITIIYQAFFHPNFNHPWQYFITSWWQEGMVLANGWTHPSSMTMFVHSFIKGVIQKIPKIFDTVQVAGTKRRGEPTTSLLGFRNWHGDLLGSPKRETGIQVHSHRIASHFLQHSPPARLATGSTACCFTPFISCASAIVPNFSSVLQDCCRTVGQFAELDRWQTYILMTPAPIIVEKKVKWRLHACRCGVGIVGNSSLKASFRIFPAWRILLIYLTSVAVS